MNSHDHHFFTSCFIDILRFSTICCSSLLGVCKFSFSLLGVFSQVSFLGATPLSALHLFRGSWTYFERSGLWNCRHGPSMSLKTRFPCCLKQRAPEERWKGPNHDPPSPFLCYNRVAPATNLVWVKGGGSRDGGKLQVPWVEEADNKDEVSPGDSSSLWALHLLGRHLVLGENGSPGFKCPWAQTIQGMHSQTLVGEREKFVPVLCIKHNYT